MGKISLRAFRDMCGRKNVSSFTLASVNQPRLLGHLQYSLRFSGYSVVPESNMIMFNNGENGYVVFNNISNVHIIEEIPGFGTVFTIVCADEANISSKESCYKFVMR